jgi:hypothetical protein
MSSRDGMKEEYTSLLHTSIRIILIDMQGMIGIQRRSEELRHGNLLFLFLFFFFFFIYIYLVAEELQKNYTDAPFQKKLSLGNVYLTYEGNCGKWKIGTLNLIWPFVCEGVIVYYGVVEASINYHMSVGSRGSQITDQFIAYSWERLSL